MGWRAEGADNPAMATQGRGLGAGGTFIPQNRFIQVLRGVCTGLDPSARAASQKPATYGAQGRCGEPHAPTMCWGVDGEPPPPREKHRVGWRGESLEQGIHPTAAGIYSRQRNVTGSAGIAFSFQGN